ncbi:MAG: hypothetical protein V2J08_14990 [Desulfotignum sp.]|jgi:spermidine synthase|nr:hypothetical protein [Desulfotignum sp.]
MIPWKLLSRSSTPDKKSGLTLYQRGTEYSIRVNGQELMNSRMFGSEKILAELSCPAIADRKTASVLIGGLGMGYTLSAALWLLHSDADVLVAELVPSVVEWNKNVFGSLAGDPLRDSRVTVVVEDVIDIINDNTSAFDAILLDVDNGPASLTQKKNGELYSMAGLSKIHRALRPGGVAAVWSSSPDKGFMRRLKRSFFHVLEKKVRGRTPKKGPVHTIWIATKSC